MRSLDDHAAVRELLRWTRSNPRTVSVSQRASVARLDEHVGPKR